MNTVLVKLFVSNRGSCFKRMELPIIPIVGDTLQFKVGSCLVCALATVSNRYMEEGREEVVLAVTAKFNSSSAYSNIEDLLDALKRDVSWSDHPPVK